MLMIPSNSHLCKNIKTCLKNKKVSLRLPLKHGHFHLILILPVKMVELLQQHFFFNNLLFPFSTKNTTNNKTQEPFVYKKNKT